MIRANEAALDGNRCARRGGAWCARLGLAVWLCAAWGCAPDAPITSSTSDARPSAAADGASVQDDAGSGDDPIEGALEADSLDADPSNAPPGRWRVKQRRGAGLETEQRDRIAELSALGYAAGTIEASEVVDEVGVTQFDADSAYDGLNLVVSGHAPEAVLMDMRGEVIHRWACTFEEAWPNRRTEIETGVRDAKDRSLAQKNMWRRVHLFPNGDLLAIFVNIGMVKLDRDSKLLWTFDRQVHHDIDVGPDGRIYVLSRESHLMPRIHPEEPIVEDFITVLGPDGRERESVSILECFENSRFRQRLDAIRRQRGDIFHTNTLEYLDGSQAHRSSVFSAGNLLISLRRQNLLAIVDLDDATVVWARKGRWKAQHQPVLLDTGNMLLFDNGASRRRRSEVLEFDPLTGEDAWSYMLDEPGAFFSMACGSSQRLPNGNTLITESDYGRAFEVVPDGAIVWSYNTPYRAGDEGELIATLFEVVRLELGAAAGWLD